MHIINHKNAIISNHTMLTWPLNHFSEVVLPLKLPNPFFPKTLRSRKKSRPPNVPRVCQVKASRRHLAINWQPRFPGRPGKSGRLDEMLLKMSKIEILMLSLVSPQIDGIYIIFHIYSTHRPLII